MHDPLNNLEHIKVTPLSQGERADVWAHIKSNLPATPVASPWSFMSRKVLTYAFAFVVVFGTVAASDGARPGQLLFPVDLAVERAETLADPSSRADHARERLAEFKATVDTSEEAGTGADLRTQKESAPQADTMMFAEIAVDEDAAAKELPPETLEAIERARAELQKIEAEAVLKSDTETLLEIQAIIDEFEARVTAL